MSGAGVSPLCLPRRERLHDRQKGSRPSDCCRMALDPTPERSGSTISGISPRSPRASRLLTISLDSEEPRDQTTVSPMNNIKKGTMLADPQSHPYPRVQERAKAEEGWRTYRLGTVVFIVSGHNKTQLVGNCNGPTENLRFPAPAGSAQPLSSPPVLM